MTEPQMCTVDEIIPGEPPCRRVAQWRWDIENLDHPVFLCNHHAEPLQPLASRTAQAT